MAAPCIGWSQPLLLLLCAAAAAAPVVGQGKLNPDFPGSISLNGGAGSRISSMLPRHHNDVLSQQMRRQLLAPVIPARFSKPYNICTSEWKPIVTCSADQDQRLYSGYQIELFRLLARDMGWDPTDYQFTCIDWSPMIEDLASTNGSCVMAAAGVETSLDMLSQGIKFSWPIYKSGYQVLISSHLIAGDTWAFAQAFHWSVWMLLGATSIFVALIVAFMERVTLKDLANKKGLQGWTWLSLSMLFHVHHHVGDPQLWASRMLLLTYGFVVLIMVHLYTATSASRFTQLRLSNTINSKADLPGKAVETWTEYVGIMRKYGIMADGLPWENDNDTDTLVNNLRNGRYKALVLDSPVVEFLAGTEKLCDLFVVGEPFETFSLGLAFPKDTDDVFIDAFSTSLVSLQTGSAALDSLENTYIKTGGTDRCFGGDSHSGDTQITLGMVSGLWYILAMSIGLSLFLLICHNIRKSPKAMERINKVVTITRRSLDITQTQVSNMSRRSVSFASAQNGGAADKATKGENGAEAEDGARGSWFQGDSMPADTVEVVRLPPKLQAASTPEPEVMPPNLLGRTSSIVSDDE